MGARSKIEWTDSTFNPWVGCTKIARPRGAPSACDFCYAEKWAKRSGQVVWGDHARRQARGEGSVNQDENSPGAG